MSEWPLLLLAIPLAIVTAYWLWQERKEEKWRQEVYERLIRQAGAPDREWARQIWEIRGLPEKVFDQEEE